MGLADCIKAKVAVLDAAARPWAGQSRLHAFAYEFLLFGLKQAWACLFGGAMIFLLVVTHLSWPAHAPFPRYDFLVVAAVLIQAAMLALKLEHWDEAAVILIFHVVGAGMELFKTVHGSWIYLEASVLRLGGVPLFSGFMYAAIGSYIARIWRMFDIRFSWYPPIWPTWVLAVAAYINFFSHHYLPDIRLGLFVMSAVLFGPGVFYFTVDVKPRRMPMLLGLILVSLFIWFAENAGTFANAWVYPSQSQGWRMVPFEKLGAWYLLMILSLVLVTLVRKPRSSKNPQRSSSEPLGER